MRNVLQININKPDFIALEVGGPTILFKEGSLFHLYDILEHLDSLNLYDLQNSFITIKSDNCIFSDIFNKIEDIDKKYDVIISSHLIEHIANPINFLNSLTKLLKPGGHIISFIPNKVAFWDKVRDTTTMSHLIQDFENNVTECDKTHTQENLNILDHPYKLNPNHPDIAPNTTYEYMCNMNENYRIMHHHCFDLQLVQQLHEHCGFNTVYCFNPKYDILQLIYFGQIA